MLSEHIKYMGEIKRVTSNEYHGKILYLMISGSDLFGFRSADSDTDYRGCFQVRTNKFLEFQKPKDFISIKTLKEGMTTEDVGEYDIYDKEVFIDELEREIKLLVQGNCNHYEHLFAKPLLTSNEHIELQKIFSYEEHMNLLGLYNSYHGMAYQNYKKFILGGKHTVKKYLYVFRGLMAGTYIMQTGKIEPNIDILSDHYKSPIIKELIDLKKRGMEKDPVNKNLDKYNKEADKWFDIILEEAKIHFPYKVDHDGKINFAGNHIEDRERIKIVNKWLQKTRIGYIDGI